MKNMKAYVLHGPEDLRLEDRAVREPASEEVLVRVRRTGICGSDVHYYLHGRIGSFAPREPFALGHECAGEVAAVGADVRGFEDGAPVAVDPQMPCGSCRFCRSGRYNLCDNMRFLGSASCYPHIDGGFAEYVVIPARNCYPVPAGMDLGYAALLEPLTVATNAVLRAGAVECGAVAGRSVLITGAGTIGQLVLLVARAFGAGLLAVSDVEAFPRDFALRYGADFAIDPAAGTEDQVASIVPDGFDVVIEVSGSPAALADSYRAVRKGGTIVQVGTQPASAELPANLVMSKELAVLGSFRSAHVLQMSLDLAASGRIDLDPIISQVYGYREMQKAVEAAVAKSGVIKIQVEQ